ncbi:MAG TPA: hypothetical protein VNO84_12715 [Burkholderiaceae bacterium]|nr:hypothetical protein [Burkholderiaceae bacterium]
MRRDDYSGMDGSGSAHLRLLRAASDLVGGDGELARRLNISAALLGRYASGQDELPRHILLRAVDLILEERDSRFGLLDGTSGERTGAGDSPS